MEAGRCNNGVDTSNLAQGLFLDIAIKEGTKSGFLKQVEGLPF
jgi:hypothetical protein